MNWSKVGQTVGKALPVVGTLLAGPQGAAIGGLVSQWLGVENTPEAVDQALQSDPAAIERLRTKALENEAALNALHFETLQTQIKETGATARAEVESSDPYVRRARPGFIYAMKWAWLVQVGTSMAAALVVILADAFSDKVDAAKVLEALAGLQGDMAVAWGFALSVIGMYNVKRSHDKQVLAGQQPTGLLQSFLNRGN